jgi:hypothetical protein
VQCSKVVFFQQQQYGCNTVSALFIQGYCCSVTIIFFKYLFNTVGLIVTTRYRFDPAFARFFFTFILKLRSRFFLANFLMFIFSLSSACHFLFIPVCSLGLGLEGWAEDDFTPDFLREIDVGWTRILDPLCRAFFKDFPVGGHFLKRDLSVR